MIPGVPLGGVIVKGIPRESGDDPQARRGAAGSSSYSPRERG